MSLREMTIQKANEIMDIVIPLMINRSQEDRSYFGYSELKGYDIYDVENALKLFNADYYFRKGSSEESEINKLLLNAKSDNAFLINLCFYLVLDSIIDELRKYKYRSSEYFSKVFELVDHKEYDKFMSAENETIESFLKYCISIGRDNPEYWLRVYYRLGLLYNPDDEIINTLNKNMDVLRKSNG
jgi:hypothetical protein